MSCPLCGSDVWLATGGCGVCSNNSISAVKCKNCGERVYKDEHGENNWSDSWTCDTCGAVHNELGRLIGHTYFVNRDNEKEEKAMSNTGTKEKGLPGEVWDAAIIAQLSEMWRYKLEAGESIPINHAVSERALTQSIKDTVRCCIEYESITGRCLTRRQFVSEEVRYDKDPNVKGYTVDGDEVLTVEGGNSVSPGKLLISIPAKLPGIATHSDIENFYRVLLFFVLRDLDCAFVNLLDYVTRDTDQVVTGDAFEDVFLAIRKRFDTNRLVADRILVSRKNEEDWFSKEGELDKSIFFNPCAQRELRDAGYLGSFYDAVIQACWKGLVDTVDVDPISKNVFYVTAAPEYAGGFPVMTEAVELSGYDTGTVITINYDLLCGLVIADSRTVFKGVLNK